MSRRIQKEDTEILAIAARGQNDGSKNFDGASVA
jgi:hypothetical protein